MGLGAKNALLKPNERIRRLTAQHDTVHIARQQYHVKYLQRLCDPLYGHRGHVVHLLTATNLSRIYHHARGGVPDGTLEPSATTGLRSAPC